MVRFVGYRAGRLAHRNGDERSGWYTFAGWRMRRDLRAMFNMRIRSYNRKTGELVADVPTDTNTPTT